MPASRFLFRIPRQICRPSAGQPLAIGNLSISRRYTAAAVVNGSLGRSGLVENNRNPGTIQNTSLIASHHVPLFKSDNRRNSLSPHHWTIQSRSISWLPEALQNFSIWGGSGWMLKTLHADGMIPYWACFAITNILVRILLLPVVVYGAQTSARFAKVLPEIQFLVTVFQNDMRQLTQRKASTMERMQLIKVNMKTLGLIYKGYKVNPLSVFLSPLLQLPIFYYVSVDLRKIVNGLDPALAQDLVESSLMWVPDLTEPDPWFGLPVLSGLMLYANVEVAMGQRNLVGKAASKANTAVLLKDIFQSLAVFMPCFTAALPSGIQIYLVTTFGFTMIQSELIRTNAFRTMVGLPMIGVDGSPDTPVEAPKFAKVFVRLKQLEQEAIQLRGDGPLLGVGVLKTDYQGSFPGTNRPSTIQGSGRVVASQVLSTPPSNKVKTGDNTPTESDKSDRSSVAMENLPFGKLPFVHGVSAPLWQQQEQANLFLPSNNNEQSNEDVEEEQAVGRTVAMSSEALEDELIEKANRGEQPIPTRFAPKKGPRAPSAKKPISLNKTLRAKLSKSKKKRRR